jgi:hypothetical protein
MIFRLGDPDIMLYTNYQYYSYILLIEFAFLAHIWISHSGRCLHWIDYMGHLITMLIEEVVRGFGLGHFLRSAELFLIEPRFFL